MNDIAYKAGFVAIVGAPNAGKSTFLNQILGEKVAIVTPKPQTTRHRILGVMTDERGQMIFWDTPGLHAPGKVLLNREMLARALAALEDSDVVLWVVDGDRQGRAHKVSLDIVSQYRSRPVIVALNKVDMIANKAAILPLMQEIEEKISPQVIVPISAKTGDGLPILLNEIINLLPTHPPLYPEDTLTDQPERAIAAEMVREAVFTLTNQEIPYSTAVTIDEFVEEPNIIHIGATIHVERESQKGVIIGKSGNMLKNIGQSARLNIERLVGGRIFLKLFVRTTRDWSKKKSTLL
ncbi:MAG: GTPase Era, partial [Candidatus Adiutrix sp.]